MKLKGKIAAGLACLLPLAFIGACTIAIYLNGMNYWFGGYLEWISRPPLVHDGTTHVMFLMVDHFEPTKPENAQAWMNGYPAVASKYLDRDGFHPRYSWFFPVEQFDKNELFVSEISTLCQQGYGEIEMHLHHNRDTEETLRAKIRQGISDLQKYGALKTVDGQTAFGFIHGNWALDNSVSVAGRDRCGVNSEILLLKEEGCYADFTFPASGNMAQPGMINCLYYATDDPLGPKSYASGTLVEAGREQQGDLMIFQGPLGVNWRDWRHVVYPAIESGSLRGNNPPWPLRIDFWFEAGIHVKGRPEWIFVKTFSHGASPANWNMLFNEHGFDDLFSYIDATYNDGTEYQLHYVTAREAYNIVKAAEAGLDGNPNQYRDFVIKPYLNTLSSERQPQ